MHTIYKIMEVIIHMDGKPIHFDGSNQAAETTNEDSVVKEPFKLTDEMRINISSNPYEIKI